MVAMHGQAYLCRASPSVPPGRRLARIFSQPFSGAHDSRLSPETNASLKVSRKTFQDGFLGSDAIRGCHELLL